VAVFLQNPKSGKTQNPAKPKIRQAKPGNMDKVMAQLKITWTKSCIGRPASQERIVRSLGLRRLHHSVVHEDTPSIRGMVNKVIHLVNVEELEVTG
jgi:large subunit ribosomal protein L30